MTPETRDKLRRLIKLAADERTPEPERIAAAFALAKRLSEDGVLDELVKPPEPSKEPTGEELANEIGVPVATMCCICDYLAFASRMGIEPMLVAAFGGGWVACESAGGEDGIGLHAVPFCFRHKLAVAKHVMEMEAASRPKRPGDRRYAEHNWHDDNVGELFRERPKLRDGKKDGGER